MKPTNEQELDEQLSVMIERDAMALCCNDCGGGGYDYDNTKKCDTCKGTGLTEWQNDYLIGQIIKLIQAYTNAEIAKVLDRLYGELMEEGETIVHQWQVEGAIAAERAKLKEVK